MFFTLVATAVETATIPTEFTPLAFLHGKTYTGALSTAQMRALERPLEGLWQMPVPLDDSALVISDNADIYGTVNDLRIREASERR